jgi:LacI family transcriptional regulator
MPKTKRVALLIPIVAMGAPQVLRGVIDYASHCGNWVLDMDPDESAISARTLATWSGDGALVLLRTSAQLRVVQALTIPVVNMAGSLRPGGVPRSMVDQVAVGQLAAEHFIERGLRRTAYFGQKGMWFSQQREQGFVARIKEAGGECSVLKAPRQFDVRHPWHRWQELLEQWLRSLTPPVGVMAVHDCRARMVLDACLRLGLRVPHDVALIGVDNDEVACKFSQVPLTSVARNYWLEGYEAAALLDRLMVGRRPPKHDLLIPPEGVITRQSTDMEAIENPHVATAVRLIREHLAEPLDMKRLEKNLDVSRRYLYQHFQQILGCTPHQYINRARIKQAKQLLESPNRIKLHQIART